jgi:hypothetical protein
MKLKKIAGPAIVVRSSRMRKRILGISFALATLVTSSGGGAANAGSPYSGWGLSHQHYIHQWTGGYVYYQQDTAYPITYRPGGCNQYQGDLYHLNEAGGLYQYWDAYWGYQTLCTV